MKTHVLETDRCWAEIDLEAVRLNARMAVRTAGHPANLMAIVKADGYGHGIIAVSRALLHEVAWFGVATLTEARELRAHVDAQKPIVILSPALPRERAGVVKAGVTPCVSTLEEALDYDALAGKAGRKLEVHLMVDTGMGRMGIWEVEAIDLYLAVEALDHLHVSGVATHLPSADEEPDFTERQLDHFGHLVTEMTNAGFKGPWIHSLNSAGVFKFSNWAGTLVRAGLMLYGISPLPEHQAQLKPALTLKSRVTLLRDVGAGRTISYGRTFTTAKPTRVATLGIGYGDGYPRHLSNVGAEVLVRGRRCPVLGRVTMDQIMVDVSEAPDAALGDEVVLIGSQGEEVIFASELAGKAGTIAWEIFTGITQRVKKVYSGMDGVME